jgi:hypothetical protein
MHRDPRSRAEPVEDGVRVEHRDLVVRSLARSLRGELTLAQITAPDEGQIARGPGGGHALELRRERSVGRARRGADELPEKLAGAAEVAGHERSRARV